MLYSYEMKVDVVYEMLAFSLPIRNYFIYLHTLWNRPQRTNTENIASLFKGDILYPTGIQANKQGGFNRKITGTFVGLKPLAS